MIIKIKDVLSQGMALGKIHKLKPGDINDCFTTVANEKKKFTRAINNTVDELNELKLNNPDLNDYLTAQELIAKDPTLEKQVLEMIDNKISCRDALNSVMKSYMESLLASSSEYLRERAQDVEDILNRLISNIGTNNKIKPNEKFILVTKELFPSILISHRDNILGVITKKGGFTSHSAIMARSFDIPFAIVDEDIDSDYVLLDTRRKLIITNPSKDDKAYFNDIISKRDTYQNKAIPHMDYLFLANVSSNQDIEKVLDYGYDAIGLYRTEMIFMNSNRPYTFDEQYSIYNAATSMMKDKFIVFRTFDCGDDKKIPYLVTNKKGIDNYIANPQIFETQISAMMKANNYNNMRIMFPMIESNSEFEYLRDWVTRVQKTYGYNLPKIGMMLETKSALLNIESFVKADFISVGTNDLTHDLYGVNRDTPISEITKHLDDMLELLKPVVEFCNKYDKCLSVCGELAAVKDVALKFYEIGIKNLSVSPSQIKMLNLTYDELTK